MPGLPCLSQGLWLLLCTELHGPAASRGFKMPALSLVDSRACWDNSNQERERPGLCPQGNNSSVWSLPAAVMWRADFQVPWAGRPSFPLPLIAALLMTSCRPVLLCFQDPRAGSEMTVAVCAAVVQGTGDCDRSRERHSLTFQKQGLLHSASG